MFSVTHKHYMFNLPYADTSLKRTLFLVQTVFAYGKFDCITFYSIINKATGIKNFSIAFNSKWLTL